MGSIFASVGVIAGIRFLYFFLENDPGHVQSVILSALCLTVGVFLWIMGLIADLIATNRRMLEKVNLRLYRIELRSLDGVSK
jgi:low temperature requirement protein LtrA